MQNPFRPSAGSTPPDVIGRSGLLDDFAEGLSQGAGAPGLQLIVTGERGTGKTIMLGVAQDLASAHGWDVIAETATEGFFDRIGGTMRRHFDHQGADTDASVSSQILPERQVDWRTSGENLLGLPDGTGLIITLDEVHAADRGELDKLAAGVQHFMEQRLPVGLVVAGLPAAVTELLNESGSTFLRQASRIDLPKLEVRDVERSFDETFTAAGFDVAPGVITRAADATGGYPFLVQLVGYFLWREAEDNGGKLTAASADRSVERAYEWNARTVLDAALSAASVGEVEFLCAMAEDEGPSAAEDIGRRMGVISGLVRHYRAGLMAAGLIETAAHGKVDFTIPGFRQHMRVKGPR